MNSVSAKTIFGGSLSIEALQSSLATDFVDKIQVQVGFFLVIL